MTDIANITVNVSVWTFPRLGRVVGVISDQHSDRPTVVEVDADG